jgi:hypothetical protein
MRWLVFVSLLFVATPAAEAMLSTARVSQLKTSLEKIRKASSRSSRNVRADQCWLGFDSTPTSFLEVGDSNKETDIAKARTVCLAALEYQRVKGETILSLEQRKGCEAIINVQNPDLYRGFEPNLYGPLWNAFPKMAGALFGRSVFSGCKCEGWFIRIFTSLSVAWCFTQLSAIPPYCPVVQRVCTRWTR